MAFAAFDSNTYECWDKCLFSQVSLLSQFSRNKYHLQHEADLFKEKKRYIKAGSTLWTITEVLIQELMGGGIGVESTSQTSHQGPAASFQGKER